MAESALITPAEFAELMGMSRTSFYQRRYRGDLPAPVIAKNRCLRWRVGDVRAWLGTLYAAEPTVRRGRPRNSIAQAVSGAQ
ncbi:helix-turn-helix transcriptional regulator [Burkholderia pyrrocinia]|uniref:helix-turn-helix transcriptional regulator n=1 Tax=Burkholderia pyrrocinia TaxID=60550 RepID=UPI003D769168